MMARKEMQTDFFSFIKLHIQNCARKINISSQKIENKVKITVQKMEKVMD